jgi:sulfonate transport system permease protein
MKRKTSGAANPLRALVWGLPLPLLLLGIWQWASTQGESYAFAFVPLQTIAQAFVELVGGGSLAINLWASVQTALTGLLSGLVFGIGLGFLMAYWTGLGRFLNPLVQALRQVPSLALIPLVALWFGNTEFSKLLVVGLAVFEVVVLNTYEGLHRVDTRYLELARALTLSRPQLFRHVLLPAALPSVATGVQHGVAFAWLATVGVELLFTVGPGLSSVMERAQTAARMEVVIVCLVFIALMGLAMHHAVRWACERGLRWRHTVKR